MRVVSSKKKYKRGSWSKQEDEKLVDYISTHGEASCSWATLPKAAGLERHGKSCRLRWLNYLRPDIKRGNFSLDEEDLIIKLHALLRNKWSLIAGRLPGRTENEVKNHWNLHIKRKLIRAGIDPNNHSIHQKLPISSSVINDGDEALSKITTKNDGDEALSKITTKNDGDEAVSSHFQTVLRPRAYSFLQRPSSPDTHQP